MKIDELFFYILKASLWGGSVGFEAGDISRNDLMTDLDVEIDKVSRQELKGALRIAKAQAVLCLVANEVMRHERLNVVLREEDKAGLMRFVMGNLSVFQMLNNTLVSIVLELRKHGIDPVLLKGQGIAKYYPVPELRQCGDIDIYVGQEKFEKACEVIGAMSTPEDHQGDIPSLKHYHTRIGHAFIEIHRYTDVYWPRQ